MTLTDLCPYLKAYSASRATLQETQPGGNSKAAAHKPETFSGIKF